MHGAVTAPFGDGVYMFRLDLERWRELQDKTGLGPWALAKRVVAGDWRVDDLRETLRLALIGGGLDWLSALKLVERYFDPAPLARHMPLVVQILDAGLSEPEAIKTPGKKPTPRPSRKTAASRSRPGSD